MASSFIRVGVEPLIFLRSLLIHHPNYSKHHCSKSAGLASRASVKMLFSIRHKQAALDADHRQVRSLSSAQCRRSRRYIVQSGADDEIGGCLAAYHVKPAIAHVRHRSGLAAVLSLLRWLPSCSFGGLLSFTAPSYPSTDY